MKILDCTLRDGGYYNNWDFDNNTTAAYFSAVAESKIDMVEIGLRKPPEEGFRGAYYYCTEQSLSTLRLPFGPEYGVMIDCKDFVGDIRSLESLFVESAASVIKFVRVACHLSDVGEAKGVVEALKKLGYDVYLNLMQVNEVCQVDLECALERLATFHESSLAGVYFADSLGSMGHSDVRRMASLFEKYWKGPLGIHAHNNRGLALNNAVTALDVGVEFIDSTISGMGRGAGNVETEALLSFLEASSSTNYVVEPVLKIAEECFWPMRTELGWGASFYYQLGAEIGIHPSYIQDLLGSESFKALPVSRKLIVIRSLKGQTSYQKENLVSILRSQQHQKKRSDNNQTASAPTTAIPKDQLQGKVVCFVGSGDSIKRYPAEIKSLLDSQDLISVVLNFDQLKHGSIDHKFDFGVCYGNPYVDLSILSRHCRSVILPTVWQLDSSQQPIEGPGNDVYVHDVSVVAGEFRPDPICSVLPNDYTLPFAVANFINFGKTEFLFIGFDGYDSGDPRNGEMSKFFSYLSNEFKDLTLTSLTPTSYPLNLTSIHAPR